MSTRFLLFTTVPRLSQIALKFGLNQPTPPPKIFPQCDPHFVNLSVKDILWQIAVEWLEIAQWSPRRSCTKPPPSLANHPTSQSPKWGSQMWQISFYIRAMSPFAKVFWPCCSSEQTFTALTAIVYYTYSVRCTSFLKIFLYWQI